MMSIASVYIDGVLSQKSVVSKVKNTIMTEIYDQIAPNMEVSIEGESNGFFCTTVHKMISTEKIYVDIEHTISLTSESFPSEGGTPRSIYDEPVDNTGLSLSSYGDGYYYLGSSTSGNYLPGVSGYLYRTYTSTYDGLTHSWT